MAVCHCRTWHAAGSFSLGLARAARMAVVVVPMLEPKVKGYALLRLITPMPAGVRDGHTGIKTCFVQAMLWSCHEPGLIPVSFSSLFLTLPLSLSCSRSQSDGTCFLLTTDLSLYFYLCVARLLCLIIMLCSHSANSLLIFCQNSVFFV